MIAAFCFIPLPYSIKCALEVQPKDAQIVYAMVPGTLQGGERAGRRCRGTGYGAGVLENDDLRLSMQQLEQSVELIQETARLMRRQLVNPENDRRLGDGFPEIEELLKSAEQQLRKEQEDFAKLQIKTPVAGTVLPAPLKKVTTGRRWAPATVVRLAAGSGQSGNVRRAPRR